MRDDLLALWPDAPLQDADSDDRWLRLSGGGRRVVYVQRYGWDDLTRPDFLVVWIDGDEPADQRRAGTFAEAVEAARSLLVERSSPLVGRPAA